MTAARRAVDAVVSRLADEFGDFSTPTSGPRLAAVLYLLCGGLVSVSAPLVPDGPGVTRPGLVLVGLVAAAVGVVVWHLPWQRLPRSASRWLLIPPALTLVSLHNVCTGADGFRFAVFFLVVFAWTGLVHPPGTALRWSVPLVPAYVLPGLVTDRLATVAASLVYAVPVCVLIGETASWVSTRMRQSERALRRSEQRFRSLVQNAGDLISVVDERGRITYESPAVTSLLGYRAAERLGTEAIHYVALPDQPPVREALARLAEQGQGVERLEVRLRHADGSWRWCELAIRDLVADPAVRGFVVNVSDRTVRREAQEAQRQLAEIVEYSADAIISADLEGRVTSWNAAAERLYGYTAVEMLGRPVWLLAPEHRPHEIREIFARLAAGRELLPYVTERRRKDGETVHVSLSFSPVRNVDGLVTGVSAIARDVTAEHRAAAALREREASFRLLFAANPQPMWLYDAQTLDFLEVNEAAVRHYGYTRHEFLARRLTDVEVDTVGPGEAAHPAAGRHRTADGRVIDAEVTTHRIRFNGRDAVLVAIQDVTERNALDRQLRHQAFHDSLTNLANRALFSDRVSHALERRSRDTRPAVLLLDLDGFKNINDGLGHAVGDELLVAAAGRLAETAEPGDTVARLGGDEFAVLVEDCPDGATAVLAAQRLLTALTAPFRVSGREVFVGASIGVAYADATCTAGDLLRNADVAMYRVKSDGGGDVRLFEPDMHRAALRRMELDAGLRRALEADEFAVHYQPIVDTVTGAVGAVEALVRWHPAGTRVVGPADFVPAAEDSGLILPLGRWVLDAACRQGVAWELEGLGALDVSVNLSGRQLADPELCGHVEEALSASGLPPERLVLEITESVLVRDHDEAVAAIRRLRALGVRLAIDDFGTGFSSLSYLRTLPVDELKIDKSFVDNLTDDPRAGSLVEAIVRMATTLGLDTVAEGVERTAQHEGLRALGCRFAQGFLFLPAAPAADVAAYVRGVMAVQRLPEDALAAVPAD